MADVSSLGTYKVVVTADYKQLREQFDAMTKYVAKSTKTMTDNLNKAMGGVNASMLSQMKTSIEELKRSFEGLGQAPTKANDGFKSITKQVKEAKTEMEKAYQEVAKLRRAYDMINNDGFHGRTDIRNLKQSALADLSTKLQQAEMRAERLRSKFNDIANVQKNFKEFANPTTNTFDNVKANIKAVEAQQKTVANAIQGHMRSEQTVQQLLDRSYQLTRRNTEQVDKMKNRYVDFFNSLKHHLTWMASAVGIGVVFGTPVKLVSTISGVEKQMAQMKQVNEEVKDSQEVLNFTTQEYIKIAERYGAKVDEVIKAGVLWGRAYKDLGVVMELTSLSAKLAVADNVSIDLANRAVESVINGFQKQGEAVKFANHVVDSWTKVAHNAQSSATDLAEALMRTSAAAKAVGVDFDTTTAMASAMIKATGRSGAEVGNALKSLFSSIHSKKALQQLKELGIEMYRVDADGQKHFRKLHDVFIDLMITSHTTSRNMEKDLLAISGGKFQWSKVASLLGSYKDFIHAYGMSINSANFSADQIGAQLDTINRRFEQLKATITGIASNVGASGLSQFIKNILVSLNAIAKAIMRIPNNVWKWVGAFAAGAAAIGSCVVVVKLLGAGMAGLIAAHGAYTTAVAAGTVATEAWAVATTAATGGLNILVAVLVAGVAAFLGYNALVSDAIKGADELAEKENNEVTAKEQQIEAMKKSVDWVATLCEAHVKLQNELENTKEGTEQNIHAKEDLAVTDKELTEVIGEDAANRIDWSRDVQDIIKQEQDVIKGKIAEEKKLLDEMKLKQLNYTRNQIEWTKNRIKALESEGYGWDALKEVIADFVRFLGKAMVEIGASFHSFQDAIREVPILGHFAKMVGYGDWGGYSRNAANSLIQTGESLQANGWNYANKTVEAFKKVPIVGQIMQWDIDHLYDAGGMGFRGGFFNTHSNRWNELEYQKNSLRELEEQERMRRINYLEQAVGNNEDDSGTVTDEPDKGKKGKKGSGRTKKEADNSIEAMLYRHMTKDLKLSHAQAIGELANIQKESSFNYLADNGTHKGLYQFDSTRWARYQKWLEDTGRANSAVSQVDFRHLYESKFVPFEVKQNNKYLTSGSTTPREYAAAFNEFIERSGEKAGSYGYNKRMEFADALDKRFAKRNGEENFDDVLGAREDAYKRLYQQFDREVEQLKTERAKIGQGVSAEEKLKIFEKIMGIGNGKNVILAEVEKAQKDYAKLILDEAKEEAKRGEAIKKSAETQVKAVEKTADAEVEFAEKLGLLNKADVRAYEYNKNEKNYAINKPILDAKLGATVDMSKGSYKDMLDAYQGLIYAQDRLEAQHYATKIMYLSRDVDATSKALNEELKLEEKYQNKRRELNQEAFWEKNKYTLGFIDSLTNAIQNGLDGILNRTKSFAEAFTDIFKSVVSDIIKLFSEDLAQRFKKWLTNIFYKPKATGNAAGSIIDLNTLFGTKKKGGKGGGGFDLMGWAQNALSSLNFGKGGKGNPFIKALGLDNLGIKIKQSVTPALNTLKAQTQIAFGSMSTVANQGMQGISAGVQMGTEAMSEAWQGYKTTQVITEEMGDTAIVASSESTAATVQATTAQMLGWIMAVLALFSLFSHRGSKTSKSTSSENLGRSPDSYYMTPTPVLQSTTYSVPSFDIGGNIEQDMFAMVHKNEMVLTPEQADVIRNTARNGGSIGGGANANVKSNINVSTVDSKGFDRVLKDYNRDLSKQVKKGIRNGYLNAKGLL